MYQLFNSIQCIVSSLHKQPNAEINVGPYVVTSWVDMTLHMARIKPCQTLFEKSIQPQLDDFALLYNAVIGRYLFIVTDVISSQPVTTLCHSVGCFKNTNFKKFCFKESRRSRVKGIHLQYILWDLTVTRHTLS